MRVFDLSFTMANVWGLPLIIGTSAEFGLNVMLRYLEDREQGGPLLARSTVMAVTLNGLTTIVGFGSLMVAAHRGIFGLGLLLTIGAACALAASLVVMPVVLRRLPRPARGEPAVPMRAPTEERAG
jgi:predicted RND superfamily exporter protein